ncbi:MAG: T9SS type A sorting domain-containing protein, partial [Patescibacteria group bacterium]|nr:T9SS type A sorting domain-containing protein [Patescibacteria group bacterium]
IKWKNYSYEDGLSSTKVYAIAVDYGGNVWFGTYFGVSKFDGEKWTSYLSSDGLVNNDIRAITVDKLGNIWFGTTNGISKFAGKNWTNFTYANGLPRKEVVTLAVDKENNIWAGFGTQDSEIFKFDGVNWTNYPVLNDMHSKVIITITSDNVGNLWFGTLYGLKKFDGTNWKTYTTNDGLIYDSVNSIAVDSAGNMWFGTSNGVSMLKLEKSTAIAHEENLPTNFALEQNYPNPFNPTTTIKYQLPKDAQVQMVIYNILGQEVKTVISEQLPAGIHEVKWDATDKFGNKVASGIYIYRMETNTGFAQARKVVFMK